LDGTGKVDWGDVNGMSLDDRRIVVVTSGFFSSTTVSFFISVFSPFSN
jgi:hypothetical protein